MKQIEEQRLEYFERYEQMLREENQIPHEDLTYQFIWKEWKIEQLRKELLKELREETKQMKYYINKI